MSSGKVAGGTGYVCLWFLSYVTGVLVVVLCHCVPPCHVSSRTATVLLWPPEDKGESGRTTALPWQVLSQVY
jgi:hypothetical protein